MLEEFKLQKVICALLIGSWSRLIISWGRLRWAFQLNRLWYIWRARTPYQRPVDTLKEWVLLNLSSPSLVAKTMLWVLDQQSSYQVPSRETHNWGLWESQGLTNNVEESSPVS